MKLRMFQIDAFSDKCFGGNPAAVVPLSEWPACDLLQAIAAENNLAETAYVVAMESPPGDTSPTFEIRWFTPAVEVNLCGHATLATAHALMQHLGVKTPRVNFSSRHSGMLSCEQVDEGYQLDFPVNVPVEKDPPEGLVQAMGVSPLFVLQGGEDWLLVYPDEATVASLKPDFTALGKVDARGVIATAEASLDGDFVSRFFGPAVGINEDPVTGSAHTVLAPYWQRRLADSESERVFRARQISSRGGQLTCQVIGDRVKIGGQAVTYLIGEIDV